MHTPSTHTSRPRPTAVNSLFAYKWEDMFIAGLDCLETAHTRPRDKSALAELESQARRLGLYRIAHKIAQTELPSEFLDGALLYELTRYPRLDGGGAIAHLILRAALVCYATSGAKCEGNLANLAQVEMRNPASQAWSRTIAPETAAQFAGCFGALLDPKGHSGDLTESDKFLDPVLAALRQRPNIARKILSATWLKRIGVRSVLSQLSAESVWHKGSQGGEINSSETAKGRPRGELHHDLRKNVRNMLNTLNTLKKQKKQESQPSFH